MSSSLDRVIDLQRLLLTFNDLERTLLLPSTPDKPDRNETDTEHSYSLAMVAWYLAQNLPHLDTDKCIRYALVHDLIEIHSGDTFMYDKDQARHDSKAERERQAAATLAKDWPDFAGMNASIRDYEARDNPESKFVYALDKLMPMIINHLSEGKNYRRHGVTLSDVKQAKGRKVAVSPEVKSLYDELIAIFESRPAYFK
jgi:putative hydrolase of HD superfamily